MAPKSWAEDGLKVGDSSRGSAHGVRRPHGCWHADHSRRLVTSLSPQSGYALGCSLPLQPDCSARLRSLLDDYQTHFAPALCSVPLRSAPGQPGESRTKRYDGLITSCMAPLTAATRLPSATTRYTASM